MTFWAYMLHCRGGAFYVGHTDNLEYRIAQHQSGLIAGCTADHLPVELVWSQDFPTRYAAEEAEKRIKGWSRAKKLALIRGDWEPISMLAKGKNGPSTSSGQTGEGDSAAIPSTDVLHAYPSPQPARPELVEGLFLPMAPYRPPLASAPIKMVPWMWAELVCHQDTPSRKVETVRVQFSYDAEGGEVWLEYCVQGAENLALPPYEEPGQRDGLWQTTCFELFAKKPGGTAYVEYNFSPSFQWACYVFSDYRQNPRSVITLDPEIIVFDRSGDHFELCVESCPYFAPGPMDFALSAVIEETDGTKSYWALAHPPGKPDFHHPDCFALHLPAPGAA